MTTKLLEQGDALDDGVADQQVIDWNFANTAHQFARLRNLIDALEAARLAHHVAESDVVEINCAHAIQEIGSAIILEVTAIASVGPQDVGQLSITADV